MNPSQHAESLGTGGQMRFEGTCLIAGLVENLASHGYVVRDAHHFAFSDLVFLVPELIRVNPAAGQAARLEVGKLDGPATLAAERAYLLAFFDRFLRGTQHM